MRLRILSSTMLLGCLAAAFIAVGDRSNVPAETAGDVAPRAIDRPASPPAIAPSDVPRRAAVGTGDRGKPCAVLDARLEVELRTAAGAPCIGHRIEVIRRDRVEDPARVVATDGAGSAVFAGLEPSEYLVRAIAGGSTSAAGQALLRDGEVVRVALQMRGEGPRVFGRILRDDGAPATDVVLAFVRTEAGGVPVADAEGLAWPDPDGGYRTAPLAPGDFLLSLRRRSDAVEIERREVRLGDVALRLDLYLRVARALRGRVTDAAGNPLAAQIVACSSGEQAGAAHVARSDAATGRYEVSGVLPGAIAVAVRARGFCAARAVLACDGLADVERDWQLEPGGTIRGRVIDENGAGAAADVRLLRAVEGDFVAAGDACRTDASGRFEASYLDYGTYAVQVFPDRCAWTAANDLDIDAGAPERDVEIRVAPGGTLDGSVAGLDPGADWRVTVCFRSQELGWYVIAPEVAADGSFTIPHVPPTSLDLEVRAGARSVAARSVTFRNDESTRWRFALP